METPFEMLSSLKDTSEVASNLQEIDFELRVKFKSGLTREYVEEFIGKSSPNIRLTDLSIPFYKRLSKACVLISYHSTSVEEALRFRIPVLLYGDTLRFEQLPASNILPSSSKRFAVYKANNSKDMSIMLKAIVKEHYGKPLTDEELSPYLFSSSVKSLNDYVLQCAKD